MGVVEPVIDTQNEESVDQQKVGTNKDMEKGEMGFEQNQPTRDHVHISRMQRLSATNPLRLVIDNATRVPPTHIPTRGGPTAATAATASNQPPPPQPPPATSQPHHHPSPPPPTVNPRSIPNPIPIPTPTHSTPTPQIAAYGKGFVKASQDTWELFEKREMETIVDSDITSAICFLTGVCSGSICVIMVAAWTATVHNSFTATISLLAFIVGYLMTRIAMALPHACVSCYYVCYAENPDSRLFDKTIPDRLALIKSNRDVVVLTPRVPPRFRR